MPVTLPSIFIDLQRNYIELMYQGLSDKFIRQKMAHQDNESVVSKQSGWSLRGLSISPTFQDLGIQSV